MKSNFTKTVILLIAIIFSSCTQEDSILTQEQSTPLFGKLELSRDASGSYSMYLETKNDIASDIFENNQANVIDVNLYASLGENKQELSQSLSPGKEESFSVKLNNTINNNISLLTIIDDDINFSKETEKDYLTSYSIIDNGDLTYELEFTVNNNIQVDFIKNQDTGEYEIHLVPGNGDKLNFSRTFSREANEKLIIVFKNFPSSESTRTTPPPTTGERPRVIIDTGNDD